jgi:hypothetical protein
VIITMPDLAFDSDGRLCFRAMPISRAEVSRYWGDDFLLGARTIEGEIDRRKAYRVLRSAIALDGAKNTFTNMPILMRHLSVSEEISPADIVGTTGSARFSDPILACDATLWSQHAIDGIATGMQAAPSIGYHFDLVVRGGEYRGQRYDAAFNNLRGHHLALTNRGRSGLNVLQAA